MKVSEAFQSHHDIWYSSALSEKAKQAKSTQYNTLGDIYQPKRRLDVESQQCFSDRSYMPPCKGHDHVPSNWHQDIRYEGYGSRRPALLLGDRKHSFLWGSPIIFRRRKHSRNFERKKMKSFF
jgi:hypothetical protein